MIKAPTSYSKRDATGYLKETSEHYYKIVLQQNSMMEMDAYQLFSKMNSFLDKISS